MVLSAAAKAARASIATAIKRKKVNIATKRKKIPPKCIYCNKTHPPGSRPTHSYAANNLQKRNMAAKRRDVTGTSFDPGPKLSWNESAKQYNPKEIRWARQQLKLIRSGIKRAPSKEHIDHLEKIERFGKFKDIFYPGE